MKLLSMIGNVVQSKWWPNLQNSPLLQLVLDYEVTDDGRADDGADGAGGADVPQPRNVEQSNDGVMRQAAKQSSKSNLQLACSIMASPAKRSLAGMVVEVVSPLRNAFGQWEAMSKSERGVRDLMVHWATEGHHDVLKKTLATLRSGDLIRMMRLTVSGADVAAEDLPGVLQAEDVTVRRTLRLVVHLCGHLAVESMQSTDTFPGFFAALLDGQQNEQRLQRLREVWETLEALEKKGQTDAFFANFVRDLNWPCLALAREVFLSLCEERWRRVPGFTLNELEGAFSGLIFTKIIEDTFKVLRNCEQHTGNKKFGRIARWKAAVASDPLGEYGRHTVTADGAHPRRAVPVKLPSTVFEADADDNSLGMEQVHKVGESHWQSPSPWRYDVAALATSTMVKLKDDPDGLKSCWLSLLFNPGSMVRHTALGTKAHLVLTATSRGILAWPLKARTAGSNTVFMTPVCNGAGCPFKHIPIHGSIEQLRNWKVADLTAVSPMRVAEAGASIIDVPGINLIAKDTPVSVLEYAAAHAFPNLTVPHMGKLISIVNAEYLRPKPTDEKGVLTVLLHHFFPDLDNDGINNLMKKRKKRLEVDQVMWSNLLEGDILEACGDLLDEDAANIMKETREVYRKEKSSSATDGEVGQKPPKHDNKPPAPAPAAAEPPAKKGDTRAAKLPEDFLAVARANLTELRDFMPPVKGASVHCNKDGRWTARLPGPEPPQSCSKAFDHEIGKSERAAFLHVVRWAWRRYEEQGGDPCPWDLSV